MAGHIDMKKSTKGFYTVEAAIFLPLVILSVISLGYFMKVEGTWENCIHGAVDESALIASRSYDEINAALIGPSVSARINDDNTELDTMSLKNIRIMYKDMYSDDLTSFDIFAGIKLDLPLGFSREFILDQGIKFRGFTGVSNKGNPIGKEGLESYEVQEPVWVFLNSGEKYHGENCTYVKASAKLAVLTSAIQRRHDSCGLCNSQSMTIGSLVFCFEGENTAYHRSTCGSIVRNASVIDKQEAENKGYGQCTKCGGS